MGLFDTITKTYVGNPDYEINDNNEEEFEGKLNVETDELIGTTRKYKLQPKTFALTVVGGATVIALILSGVKAGHYTLKRAEYETLKNDDNLRESTIYELVDENETTIDDLLNQANGEYLAFEKFRSLLNTKRIYIDARRQAIDNYKTQTYNYNYEDITNDYLDSLGKQFISTYAEFQKDPSNIQLKNELSDICSRLDSIGICIDNYSNKYGKDVITSVANKVYAGKVADANGINPDDITDIKGSYSKNGKTKITIKLNNKDKYKSNFKNDDEDFVKNIAKDINNENYLDAAHEIKILAADKDYNNFKTKTR